MAGASDSLGVGGFAGAVPWPVAWSSHICNTRDPRGEGSVHFEKLRKVLQDCVIQSVE